jgi:hypothetical protein
MTDWQLPCGCARFTGTARDPIKHHPFYCELRRRWIQGMAWSMFDESIDGRLEWGWVMCALSPHCPP